MTSVTWVKDANDFYEVSSPEHLIQIMHGGAKFTDSGDAPTAYSNANTKFLQTIDIDLANYHDQITPISGSWWSVYDGGNHAIANWQFLTQITGSYTGFFTTLRGVFKNVRLTGIWKISGNNSYKGFIAGFLIGADARIDNVTAIFEKGTEIYGTNNGHAGAFVGRQQTGSSISGCTLGGVVDFLGVFSQLGGFVGSTNQPVSMTYCGNFATFPKGILATAYCGGMIGYVGSGLLTFHNNVNGMIGDIGNDICHSAGGMIGDYITHDTPPVRFDTLVVAMQGNLTCKSNGNGVGGIIGFTYGNDPIEITKAVNYMSGNISGNRAGGLVGWIRNLSAAAVSVTNSIVAMNGNVEDDAAVHLIQDTTNADVRVKTNTDFGLTFATNNYSSTDALVDFVTDDVFTLLPYPPMSGTSEEGTAVALDPVFGNLSGIVDGASPYRAYSTLIIHTSPEIFYPTHVNMGFSDTNTSKYLTYGEVTPYKLTVHVDDAISGPVTTFADTVFNMAGTLLKGLEWTQNGSNEYEVATVAHLLQLMSNGAVYDDFGASPSYMTDSFTQTSDINLAGAEGVVSPIGDAVAPFTGAYSGSSHAISNWAYDRGSPDDGTGIDIGLFGRIDSGSVSGLKLTGMWSMSGSCDAHGLLVGKLVGTSASVSDIDSSFDAGSSISSGHATSSTCGLLIGAVEGSCTVTGVRVGGHLSYDGSDSVLGGVVGSVSDGASVHWVDSHATLTNGLGGSNTIATATTGGIIGMIGVNAVDAFHLSNNSNGSITGGTCGGIVGSIATGTMTRADTWANGMTGDIVGSTCAGGVVGEFEALSADVTALSKLTNYMSGDITSAASGGVIGRTLDSSSGTSPVIPCTNSVVAMHGAVADTAVGHEGHPVSMAISVNSDFGMAYTTNTYATTDPLTGYETVADFPLPFLPTTGTEGGLTHDREAVFPNVKGVAESSPLFGYEVAVVHSCPEIYVPYHITFDFVSDGTKYVTYANVTKEEVYVFPELSVTSSSSLYTMDYDENAKFGMLHPIAQAEMDYRTTKHIHSFTNYTDEYVIGTQNSSHSGTFDPINLWVIGSHVATGFTVNWIRPRGLHYNPVDQNLYFVYNDNMRIAKAKIDGSSGIVYVADDATYNTLAGDSSNTYMFGSRVAGGVNQVFRIDSDGTNMITADVSALIGSNVEVNGFTSNRDDERIYFSDTNSVVYSLSWALDDIQTMPFELQSVNHASIYYHQGMIYFGGKHPITGQNDSQIYVYDLTRGGFRNLQGINRSMNVQSQGTIGRNNFFVHSGTNRLLIVSEGGIGTHQGTDFDLHTSYITKGTQYPDGYDISWLPVDGATSYKVDINGVVTSVADTTYTTRGHADGDSLSVKLSYSTDDTTYNTYRYGYTTLIVASQFSEKYIPGGLPVMNTGSATWSDPYDNPQIALLCGSGNMYTYNVVTRTVQFVNARNMYRLDRCPTTKDIIAVGNNATSLFNAGVNAVHIRNNTLPVAFYTHTSGIKHIHCSYSGLVYFVDVNNDVWSVELDGTNAQMIVSTSDCKVVATDLYDPDKVVYTDGTKVMYLNLSSNLTTEVYGSNRNTFTDLFVINDLVYFTYNNHLQSVRVRLDGTVENDGSAATYYGYTMLVDPTQQKVFLFGRTEVVEVVDGTYTMPSFPPNPSSMIVTSNPLGLLVTWGPVDGALEYRVGTSVGVEGENAITIRHTTVDDLVYRHSAEPESTHTVYLFYDTSAASDVLHSSRTVTLPQISNSAEDFDKDFFVSSKNSDEYDLTEVKGDFGVVLNDLFQTGDTVNMKLPSGKAVKTHFVRRGETIRITNDAPISVPFSRDAGAGQKVSLTLSDDSTVDVEFNETTETIMINGVEYQAGDTLIMDGQKVTVVDA